MQCVWRRWNVLTIGCNATEYTIAPLALTPQRNHIQPFRAFSSASRHLKDRDDHATLSAATPAPLDEGDTRISEPRLSSRIRKAASNPNVTAANKEEKVAKKELEQWRIQKAALKEKFGDQAWNPRKRLSPDTIEGIRAMHASDPDRFTTPVLSQHFKVSAEAIRRILRSKWQPSPEEHEKRRLRWEKRGEKVWSALAEMGVKPPKPWRVRGVGRAAPGEIPLWKGGRRAGASGKDSGQATVIRRDLVASRASAGESSGPAAGSRKDLSSRIL